MESVSNRQLHIEEIKNTIDPVDDLQYENVDSRYRMVQIVITVIGYLILAASGLFLLLLEDKIWCVFAEGIIAVAFVVNLIVVCKAWRYKGYALRQHDLSYRSGVIFPTITTIPYDRVQQVSLQQNPVDRFFGLCSVEVVNGAQELSSLTIPGLTEERATALKSIIIERMRNGQD